MKLVFPILLLLSLARVAFAQKTMLGTEEKGDPSDPTQLSDPLPPQVSCLGLVVVNVTSSASTKIWADDLIFSYSDNATPVQNLLLGIRRAGSGTGFPVDSSGNPVTFAQLDCSDAGSSLDFEVWVMDASGNTAMCVSILDVFDNFGACSGSPQLKLCARTYCGDSPVEEVVLQVSGTAPFVPTFSIFVTTDANGCSNFSNIPLVSTAAITFVKDDNPLQGVTQTDLALLSMHLDGTMPFSEPWQYVAADVNKDGVVNAQDKDELQNLILGIYTQWPKNSSWRFIPSDYVFPFPDPLSQPIPESITVAQLLTNLDLLFRAVKIGDLDCSSQFGGQSDDRFNVVPKPHFGKVFPNPTAGGAQLPVFLPAPERVRLELFDATGRAVWVEEQEWGAGQQWVSLPASAMTQRGAFAWRAVAGTAVASGQILRQ